MSLLWVIPFASHSPARVGRAESRPPSPALHSSSLHPYSSLHFTVSHHHFKLLSLSHQWHLACDGASTGAKVLKVKSTFEWLHPRSVPLCCQVFFFSFFFFCATVGHTLVMSLKDCHDYEANFWEERLWEVLSLLVIRHVNELRDGAVSN